MVNSNSGIVTFDMGIFWCIWPNWKKAVQITLDLGYDIVSMFFEGRRDKQLEYFMDFPKGSLLIRFAAETDIFRAKEIFEDRVCIMGNVPITLLQAGSPQDVEEYCKKLITVCGKDGGFILRCSTDYTQEAKPENVKAMIDSVNKYGWYWLQKSWYKRHATNKVFGASWIVGLDSRKKLG